MENEMENNIETGIFTWTAQPAASMWTPHHSLQGAWQFSKGRFAVSPSKAVSVPCFSSLRGNALPLETIMHVFLPPSCILVMGAGGSAL